MKFKSLFLIICAAMSIGNFVSCSNKSSDDKSFDVPPLTESNSIQFVIDVSKIREVQIFLGGRSAVDWGDGTIDRVIDVPAKHIYEVAGDYQVKIWSEELIFLNIPGLNTPMSQLKIGAGPLITYIILNNFTDVESLDMGILPNLEILNIGNTPKLTKLDLSKCPKLEVLDCYSMMNIESLDLSNNTLLSALSISNTNIKEISVEKNSVLKSMAFLSNTELSNIAFASNMPSVTSLTLSRNRFTELDPSIFPELSILSVTNHKVESLDLSSNHKLTNLVCYGNSMTNLSISEKSAITRLDCFANKLQAYSLNEIYKRLPVSVVPTSNVPSEPNTIAVFGNLGAATSDVKIAQDKGWLVITERPVTADGEEIDYYLGIL